MKASKNNINLITFICATLLLFSCGKDDPKPDDQQQGLRDRTFNLYVESIQAHTWDEPLSEYEGVKAGDKAGTLRITLAGDESSYWYDHRVDLEPDYQSKWEGKSYNLTNINVHLYKFGQLNKELWMKQFTTEEEILALSEEDLEIRVPVGKVPLNDVLVTVYAFLRAEEI